MKILTVGDVNSFRGRAAHLSVEVKSPSVTHTLVARTVEDWLDGGAKSPKEAVEKRRLKELLGS